MMEMTQTMAFEGILSEEGQGTVWGAKKEQEPQG